MKIRARVVLSTILLVSGASAALIYSLTEELRPRYLESMEVSLAETAALLASLVENRADLAPAVANAKQRHLGATIFEVEKDQVELRVLQMDGKGTVLYDSEGQAVGQDYSKWNDVARTLKGEYGARSSHESPADPKSSMKYVSAPVREGGKIVGVVSVGKPSRSVLAFLRVARRKVMLTALVILGVALFVGIGLSLWITRPIQRLATYARAVRLGVRVPLPALGRGEMADLGRAFEEMREALEGKKYVEKYTQTLTHELKSPLSAIRGAAELLTENPPELQRKLFLGNIRTEAERINGLVERMLLLSSIEGTSALSNPADVSLKPLVEEVLESFAPQATAKGISLRPQLEEAGIKGDPFLLRQAVSNLVQNAIEFSPKGGSLAVWLRCSDSGLELAIEDQGPGIPDYARDKVFDRFYSLPRPDSGKKSSGLGLNLVREVATLHRGTVALENVRPAGARATLRLPL